MFLLSFLKTIASLVVATKKYLQPDFMRFGTIFCTPSPYASALTVEAAKHFFPIFFFYFSVIFTN